MDLHFIRDARGHLQCRVGLCVLVKGIAAEKFRSNTKILQLPGYSQKTPLSAVGINLTTFTLLVSLYIQGDPGRGGGWVGGMAAKCVCILLSGWGCCFPSVRTALHLPRLLSDRATYITTPTPLFLPPLPLHHPYSLSPSLHPSTSPPTLPLTCSLLSRVLVSLHFPFHLLAAPHTPLARPPWVSFTSMMPHHYPWPTLSIIQQLCCGAHFFTGGLIPVVSHHRSQLLK